MDSVRYGNWPSPLAAEALAQGNVRLGFPQFDDAGALYWTELRSAEAGRTTVVKRTHDGETTDLLPAPWSARTRVHEYGGLSYLVNGSELLFVSQADQQLWRLRLDEPGSEPQPLTKAPNVRFAEPILDRTRQALIAVAEDHSKENEPRNMLVSIDLASGAHAVLASGRDFYASPALSANGRELAFLAWDHPHMPWDAAEVWLAARAASGRMVQVRQIAGGAEASAFQPTWSPDGLLYFSLEREGFWNLHRYSTDGLLQLVAAQAMELGAPLWQLGTRLFEFESEHSVIGACFEKGLSRIVRIDTRTGAVERLTKRYPHVGQLAAAGGELACVLGWSGSGSQLNRIQLASGATEVVRNTYAGLLEPADTATPEALSWTTGDGETAHGIFYAPKNQRVQAPDGDLPPLLVLVHGGPTACTAPVFNPGIQFWTTRGFAVLDVNYRGSSGFGRPYRDRLRGAWGVVDVDDCASGARHLGDRGRVDPKRLVIRGGSAGGYTVLRALTEHDVFAAGSCHYGISDLEALARDTHKFESHYDRFLIGPYPERKDLFIERSPIHAVAKITRPIIFFQGLDDKVVPANQTERMAETLKERGIEAEYHGYEGEQHGFRKAETIRDVLDTELAFLRRALQL